jgi:uncharacterized protein YkwD
MKSWSLVVLMFTAPSVFASDLYECAPSMSDIECLIYKETNRVRVTNGESKLLISPECTEAAIYHAESMEESGVYAHEIKGYKNFGQRMDSFRVRGSRMAENIHHRAMAHFKSNEEAARIIVADWYNSKGHRKNMMNSSFKSIGISVVGDYQVQCFTDYADSRDLEQARRESREAANASDSKESLLRRIKIPNPFKR